MATKPTRVGEARQRVLNLINATTAETGIKAHSMSPQFTALVVRRPGRPGILVFADRMPQARQSGEGNIRYKLGINYTDDDREFWSPEAVVAAVLAEP